MIVTNYAVDGIPPVPIKNNVKHRYLIEDEYRFYSDISISPAKRTWTIDAKQRHLYLPVIIDIPDDLSYLLEENLPFVSIQANILQEKNIILTDAITELQEAKEKGHYTTKIKLPDTPGRYNLQFIARSGWLPPPAVSPNIKLILR